MQNVIISNPLEFERKKATIKRDGAEKLHVVADCDRTLTTCFVNGRKIPSLIALIREHKYLSPDYAPASFALYDKYHPFEYDASIPLEERKAKMVEWWSTHVKLIAKSGMSRKIVQQIISEQNFHGRKGVREFLAILNEKKVPVLIFSGAVTDFIEGFLEKEKMRFPNIHVISNSFSFDEKGNCTGYRSEIVHTLNKNEHILRNTPYFNNIAERKNVLLLGDAFDDLKMVEGLKHDVVLKIGFLNEHVERDLQAYKNNFDAVILSDGSMEFVNELLEEVLGKK